MIKEIKYQNKTFKTFIENENEHLQKFWANGMFYETQMLDFIQKRNFDGLNFVDVGGCIGNHTLFFAGVLNAAKVTTFEPVKVLCEIAKKVIDLNGLSNKVEFYNVALSDRKKTMKMFLSDFDKNAGMSKLDESGDYTVNTIRLDSIKFDSIDVMKIDIEGENISMLKGAKTTIMLHKPDIYIESTSDFKEVSDLLKEYGYKYTGFQFNRTPTHLFIQIENEVI